MTTFSELGITPDILKGLEELGFTAPTQVQEQIIPIVLANRVDLVGLAQTGTGKTAAFGIPAIQLCDADKRHTQALVLCPTRELCVQVAKDLSAFSRYVPGLKVLAVYGGASIETQIKGIKRGAQIIVATPGRLGDLIRRRAVDISAIGIVVLDEADEMLQMGFQDELNAILAQTPKEKNTLLFSATMPAGVASIAKNYMTDPKEITVGQRNTGSENIRHIYYMVRAKDRYNVLRRIADFYPDIYSIVFCRTRQETQEVADKLIQDGYNAEALHGDLSQAQRDLVLNKFRRRNLQMLVATDVAARGLDVTDLTHVINYNLPDEIANYTHRSGRTGRAGKSGISIAIIHLREKYRIREIENRLKRKFEQGHIPSGAEVCERKLLAKIEEVAKVQVDHAHIDPFLPAISQIFADMDREELIKRFVSLDFNKFFADYKNAPDLNISEAEQKSHERGKPEAKAFGQPGLQKFTRFLLHVGKFDGIHAKRLIGQLNDATGLRNIKVGKIEVMDTSSILEADSRFSEVIMAAFGHLMINGKDVNIEIVGERVEKPGRHTGGPAGRPGKKPFSKGKAPFRKPGKPGPARQAAPAPRPKRRKIVGS